MGWHKYRSKNSRSARRAGWFRFRLPRFEVWISSAVALLPAVVDAQNLRFDNRREVAIPKYAVVRIGPFYSTARFTQSAGYRWTRSSGAGTDYLTGRRRGTIREDGSELPLISTLTFRNYLLITRNMDLDLSVRMRYAYYPLDTQEDDFYVDLVDERITGTLSTEMRLTPYIRGLIYDRILIRTDYVDTRGIEDDAGGTRYEYFRNVAGLDLDWLMAENRNFGVSFSRRDNVALEKEFEDQDSYEYSALALYEHRLSPGLIVGARARHRWRYYDDAERSDTRIEDYNVFLRASEGAGARMGLPITDATTLNLSLGSSAGYVTGRGTRTTEQDGEVQTTDRERDADSLVLSGAATLRTQMSRNLWHALTYRRGVRSGFNSAFEDFDTWNYRISYTGGEVGIQVYSRYVAVEPTLDSDTKYTDWRNGVRITYPLTHIVTLVGSSEYAIRDNQAYSGDVDTRGELTGDVEEAENRSDYDTWTSRLGTSFGLTKKIDFNTYIQHYERISDDKDLEFTRDTFAANLVFSHQF